MSDPALHQRATALFLELRELAAPERERRLSAVATVDPALAEEVGSLLAHDQEQPSEELPERIGPYRILRRLGSGASGQVFLGEQLEPVRRKVALKVVPLAAFDSELAARFQVERRALEATDHPGIARVLDTGRTADGLPYLVMNFVEGEPIDAYCRRRGLALEARVRLLLAVISAVEHAHQRGVIHRDLKPANVLVSESDERAQPQVLDFGIAKPVSGSFVGELPVTAGWPMGTPAYMAPEQTRSGPIDTRADVYALGAMLYELIAGRPPLPPQDDPLLALANVRELVPIPPSRARARALEHGSLGAVPGMPSSALLGDLDWIVGKALEKEPERRYGSAAALREDLERLLASQPILARPPRLGHRLRLYVRRNRVLAASGLIVVAALLAGLGGLWSGLHEARRQMARAEDQFDAQVEINRFLTDDLLAGGSPESGGPDLSARELLDRASDRVDARLSARPLAAAAIHHALGEAYAQLADYEVAERHLGRALELRRAIVGVDAPDTVVSEIAAASLLARSGQSAEARLALERCCERARRILGSERPELYTALNDLGVVLLDLEQPTQALVLLDEALAGRRRLLPEQDPQILDSLNNTALALDAEGRIEESLALQLEALARARGLPGLPRMTLLGLENNVGATLQDLDRDREAEPHLRAAAELATQMLGPDHPATWTIESNLAGLQSDLGQPERALEIFERVGRAQGQLLGEGALDTLTTRHGYWSAMRASGRAAEAVDGFLELLRQVEEALGAEHSLAALTEVSLAKALTDLGEREQALEHAREGERRLRERFGPEHPRSRSARTMVEELERGLPGGR